MLIKFQKYNIFQLFSLFYSVVVSKIFISYNVRIVRLPYFILGRKNILFSSGFSSGRRLRLECYGAEKSLIFGKNVKINDDVHIGCINSISIGDNVLIGSKVLIIDHHHGSYSGEQQDAPSTPPDDRALHSLPILIGNNVWIGEMTSILPGVSIGDGSIIGAGSIVTKNIPAYCIAVGNPCNVIKRYNFNTSKWENFHA